MENDPFIADFPIKTSNYSGFSMAMLNNQRVDGLIKSYRMLRNHVCETPHLKAEMPWNTRHIKSALHLAKLESPKKGIEQHRKKKYPYWHIGPISNQSIQSNLFQTSIIIYLLSTYHYLSHE